MIVAVIAFFRVIVHLLIGLSICGLVFPFSDAAKKNRHIQNWSRKLVGLCGVSIKRAGLPHFRSSVIVANHVSWLDIFVINSFAPCRFVAKAEISSWPVLGWLCARSGTIFIARGKTREVRRTFKGLVESVKSGDSVAFFPEGTTSSQGSLLPFHSNLFEAAIDADVPVQPCAIRYLDKNGALHPAANFTDEMSFFDSLMSVLRSGAMTVELTVLSPISGAKHRRELAAIARGAIEAALD